MVKANPKINLLLNGVIIIALASSAFAADPQKDDLKILLGKNPAIMGPTNRAVLFLDPNTGSVSFAGFKPVGAELTKNLAGGLAASFSGNMAGGVMNFALPPPGNMGVDSAAAPAFGLHGVSA